jgi:hypothetical protein
MTENMQADSVQSRQVGFVRCCLNAVTGKIFIFLKIKTYSQTDDKTLKYVEIIDTFHKMVYNKYCKNVVYDS